MFLKLATKRNQMQIFFLWRTKQELVLPLLGSAKSFIKLSKQASCISRSRKLTASVNLWTQKSLWSEGTDTADWRTFLRHNRSAPAHCRIYLQWNNRGRQSFKQHSKVLFKQRKCSKLVFQPSIHTPVLLSFVWWKRIQGASREEQYARTIWMSLKNMDVRDTKERMSL